MISIATLQQTSTPPLGMRIPNMGMSIPNMGMRIPNMVIRTPIMSKRCLPMGTKIPNTDRRILNTDKRGIANLLNESLNDVCNNYILGVRRGCIGRVVISISGFQYNTRPQTLNRYPETLLGNPELMKNYYDEEAQEYFFDRNR